MPFVLFCFTLHCIEILYVTRKGTRSNIFRSSLSLWFPYSIKVDLKKGEVLYSLIFLFILHSTDNEYLLQDQISFSAMTPIT